MSLKLHGLGKITGIDQGLSVVGVTTLHNELSVGGDVVVGGGLTVTGVLTYEDVTNVDSIGIITARSGIVGDLTGNVTGNVTGDITGDIIGSPTLSGISSSIADTAVDVFVYDTSKDSDGGAWRKRTQHTSWYNETLNTSTRGSRREFPAVAVIVVETGQVTIYDGDDPDLPMWMVFNGTAGGASHNLLVGTGSFCLSALNGTVFMGALAIYVNFISEYSRGHRSSGGSLYWNGPYNGNIAERNAGRGSTKLGDKLILGGSTDVAMSVLLNAPVDVATGLPVPTIAVATGGGVSVIKDDGSVVDLTTSDVYDVYGKVEFGDNNNRLYYTGTNTQVLYSHAIPSADQNYTAYNTQNTNRVMFPTMDHGGFTSGHPVKLLGTNGANNPLLIVKNKASGSNETSYAPSGYGIRPGLTFIDEGETNPTSMVAYATTSYNTGWMHGDIKGAFLSDTDTTNLSTTDLGLITNGDFSNGTTGWSNNATEIFTVSGGGVASVDRNGGSAQGQCYQTITTEVGRTYTVGVLVNAVSHGFQVYAGEGSIVMNQGAINSTGTHYWTFTAISTSTRLDFSAVQNVNGTASFDNITIFDGSTDRSTNRRNLSVYGTITKSAVATGAELVAYSGFSSSNVLVQPYNSNLNPGTGNYSFMCWFKCSSTGSEQVLMRRFGAPTVTGGTMMRIVSSSSVIQWYVRDTSSTATAVNSTGALDDGNWHCAVGTREGSTAKLYIDGKLDSSSGCSANSHDPGTTADLVIGAEENTGSPGTYQNPADVTSLALVRYSLSAPSAEQVKKMYEDEKHLFQENAKATLYGSSDAVTALGYDEDTELLHVGTSAGRSDFQGLRRINNTTTAVTTAISASGELIAEQ